MVLFLQNKNKKNIKNINIIIDLSINYIFFFIENSTIKRLLNWFHYNEFAIKGLFWISFDLIIGNNLV